MTGPTRDGENIPADELTAFSLEDFHGYRDVFRRAAWTVVFVGIVVVICAGLLVWGRQR